MKRKPFFTITSAEFDKDRWVFDKDCTRVEDIDNTIDGDRLVFIKNINSIPYKDAFDGERVYVGMLDEIGQWDFNDKNETK